MARRLMSRRGGSASQPQVTPYQQIELDDGWREWENTKQELVLVKRQLTEKDALILQLKTASRRLHETLRKKDKDLQAAFAILRSPQNAKPTKTRKQELIDRLVSECMQRAATSEALAEERRQELNRMKHSSKFLRFQELEIEIEECHREIERLRAKLETTSAPSPTVIAGKLKLSSVPQIANSSGNFTGTLLKKTKLDPLNLVGDKSPESRQTTCGLMNSNANKLYSSQSAVGQVRVVPLVKYDHREGFVSKTRRRALEAEYYKQVRLAQLEVECELEENLHIRAAREAKRLEAIEHQARQTELFINSARFHEEHLNVVLGSSEPMKLSNTEGVELSNGHDDSEQVDANTVKPVMEQISPHQVDEPNGNNTDITEKGSSQHEVEMNAEVSVENSVLTGAVKEITPEESEVQATPTVEVDVEALAKQKTYEDDDFDASDDNTKEKELGRVEQSVWNADPNPANFVEADLPSESGTHTDRVVWNADPHTVGSDASIDAASVSESDGEDDVHDGVLQKEASEPTEGNVWNLDPISSVLTEEKHVRADVSFVDSDKEYEVHDGVLQRENLVPSEGNVWNLDPTPFVPTDEKHVHTEASDVQCAVQEAVLDDAGTRKIWNLDPSPSSASAQTTNTTEVDDAEHHVENENPVWNLDPVPSTDQTHTTTTEVDDVENEQSVWNVDPDPVVEAVSRPAPPSTRYASEELPAEISANNLEENVIAGANNRGDPNPPDTFSVVDPTTDKERGASPWNLDPNPSPSGNDDHSQTQELLAGAEDAEIESTINTVDTSVFWNLDPRVSTVSTVRDDAGSSSPGNEKSVWNLDPHTGDTSEPSATVATSGSAHDSTTAMTNDHQQGRSEEGYIADNNLQLDQSQVSEEATVTAVEGADSEGDIAKTSETVEPTSYQSSPRESEENLDDATQEYTPPSTARDSDAGYDD